MVVLFKLLFFIWFIVTILWQFKYFQRNIRFHRLFNSTNLIPIWTFFSPTPGTFDVHVLFRDKLTSGEVSEWKEISYLDNRRWFHFIYNPDKRYVKVILDLTNGLKLLNIQHERDNLNKEDRAIQFMVSDGYIHLLDIVLNYSALEEGASRQFQIVEKYHYKKINDLVPVFTSAFHLK